MRIIWLLIKTPGQLLLCAQFPSQWLNIRLKSISVYICMVHAFAKADTDKQASVNEYTQDRDMGCIKIDLISFLLFTALINDYNKQPFWPAIWRYCKTSCHIYWLLPRNTSNYWWNLTAARGAHQKPGFDWWRRKHHECEKIRATIDVVMRMSAKWSAIVPKP